MVAKTYELDFRGYWREPNIGGLPAKSGVYGVYRCTHTEGSEKVHLVELIYIGESDNVKSRVAKHEKWEDWLDELRPGEQIRVNVACISPDEDREWAEAAMIHEHQPVCNWEYRDNFPFDTTTILTSKDNALMEKRFKVRRTI